MPTTAAYAHWTNIVDSTASTVEQTVAKFLAASDPDWAAELEESGALEDIVQEYRDAINAALPAGITLAGSEFIGPVDCDPAEWDGDYPITADGRPDIAAIVAGVDLGEIVERHATHRHEEDSTPMSHHAEFNVVDLDGSGAVELEIGELGVWADEDDDGETVYQYEFTGRTITSVVLDVTTDNEVEEITEAAEAALEGLGYTLVEDWQYGDVSLYARVVRDHDR